MNKKFPRKLYDFFVKHWLLTALILTIPSHWLVFLKYFGKNLGLITKDGLLNSSALYIFWPLFAISLVFAILKSATDKYDQDAKNNGQYILDKMIQSMNSIKKKKFRRFVDYIQENYKKRNQNPFSEITQPKKQIEGILENIQGTLSDIFGIHSDDIGLSIIYKTNTERKWKWLYTINIENDLPLETLIKNKNTSAYQIISKKTTSIFYADKIEGIKNNEYYAGAKDKQYNNIGSVICRDISISNKKNYLRAVLSITTYGKMLCPSGDEESKYKIENLLLPSFEYRLKLELALLYIKEVIASNPKQKHNKTLNTEFATRATNSASEKVIAK